MSEESSILISSSITIFNMSDPPIFHTVLWLCAVIIYVSICLCVSAFITYITATTISIQNRKQPIPRNHAFRFGTKCSLYIHFIPPFQFGTQVQSVPDRFPELSHLSRFLPYLPPVPHPADYLWKSRNRLLTVQGILQR